MSIRRSITGSLTLVRGSQRETVSPPIMSDKWRTKYEPILHVKSLSMPKMSRKPSRYQWNQMNRQPKGKRTLYQAVSFQNSFPIDLHVFSALGSFVSSFLKEDRQIFQSHEEPWKVRMDKYQNSYLSSKSSGNAMGVVRHGSPTQMTRKLLKGSAALFSEGRGFLELENLGLRGNMSMNHSPLEPAHYTASGGQCTFLPEGLGRSHHAEQHHFEEEEMRRGVLAFLMARESQAPSG